MRTTYTELHTRLPYKRVSHRLLTRTNVFAQQLWALDTDEVELAFLGNHTGEQRLTGAGRAVQ